MRLVRQTALRVTTAIVGLASHAALAQEYAVKPRRFVIPFPPGGHTFVMPIDATLTMNQALYSKLPDCPVNRLALVTRLSRQSLLVAAHPKLPVKSLKERVDYAKAKPGEVNYATGTRKPIVDKLSAEVGDVLNLPDINQRRARFVLEFDPTTSEGFAAAGHPSGLTPARAMTDRYARPFTTSRAPRPEDLASARVPRRGGVDVRGGGLVGRAGFEPATNGLKVRCSTN